MAKIKKFKEKNERTDEDKLVNRTIRLPESYWEKLDVRAIKEGSNRSVLIREFVFHLLNEDL